MFLKNELLTEKYETQYKLNDQSNNNLNEYFKNIEKIVKETENKNNLKFKIKEHQHC